MLATIASLNKYAEELGIAEVFPPYPRLYRYLHPSPCSRVL